MANEVRTKIKAAGKAEGQRLKARAAESQAIKTRASAAAKVGAAKAKNPLPSRIARGVVAAAATVAATFLRLPIVRLLPGARSASKGLFAFAGGLFARGHKKKVDQRRAFNRARPVIAEAHQADAIANQEATKAQVAAVDARAAEDAAIQAMHNVASRPAPTLEPTLPPIG